MTDINKIKTLIKEAKIYHNQGLLEQARERYVETLNLIHNSKDLSDKESISDSVNKRLKKVEEDLEEVEEDIENPDLSEDVQELIGNLFSFSKNNEIAAIEGAVALAKFGQHDKAVSEFQRLIKNKIFPMMSAKNMLRCLVTFASHEKAINQFKRLAARDIFNERELKDLREFLNDLLMKEGIKCDLSDIDLPAGEDEKYIPDVLEISSIRASLEDDPHKGRNMDFDITFQQGNTVSIIIKAGDRRVIDALKPGTRLSRVQCYSPMSVFNARAIVSDKKQITSGPKRGDYFCELIVEGP